MPAKMEHNGHVPVAPLNLCQPRYSSLIPSTTDLSTENIRR